MNESKYIIEPASAGKGRYRVRNTETNRVVVDYCKLDVAKRAVEALNLVANRVAWPDALDVEKTLPAE